MIIGVLVELSNKNIDRVFDYKVPNGMIKDIKIGIRVEIPFGYQTLEGFVVNIKKETNIETKEIIRIIDKDIVLNKEQLFIGKKMQELTLSTLISCYQVMLPKALKAKHNTAINKKYDTYYILTKKNNIKLNSKQQEIINLLKEKKEVKREELLKISVSSLNTLLKKDMLKEIKKEHYRLEYEQVKTEKKHDDVLY